MSRFWYMLLEFGNAIHATVVGLLKLLENAQFFDVIAASAIAFIAWDALKRLGFNLRVSPQPKWLFKIGWFTFPFRSLMRLEGSTPKTGTIYILAPNMTLDTELKIVMRTVDKNLKKGVAYKFIIPNDEDGIEFRDKIRHIHSDPKFRLSFALLENAQINAIAAENIMIVAGHKGRLRGFLQIPDNGPGLWWAEMSSEATKIYHKNIQTALGEVPVDSPSGGRRTRARARR